MSEKKSFYITTTLPYVNSDPHVGFAMEIIRADAIARYKRLMGYEVFFNTGTDEHGMKIYEKAMESNKTPQEHVDLYVKSFHELKEKLNLSYTKFIRTTDKEHIEAAQKFWNICKENGDIYKKKYQAKYCIGCEMERHDSEIENGRCFIHQNIDLQIIEEENYFFAFSKYQKKLQEFYNKNPDFVIPDFRFNEIKKFVESGLQDFSVSRLKSKMPWGIEVPDDTEHVMYVWFDALVNYISTLGWPNTNEQFDKFWKNGTPVQYCGKDNLRQQSAMWQAMLMSADLPPSRHIIIDGFINSGGKKMSKSLGNVISPIDVVNEYGTDALRYFLLREIPSFEDGDFTMEKFKEAYNANLANGLGNLVSRIMKMSETNDVSLENDHDSSKRELHDIKISEFDLKSGMDMIWQRISQVDNSIQSTQPFKLVKTDPEEGKKIIKNLLQELFEIADILTPFLPETSAKIKELIKANKSPSEPLFARKD